MAESIGTTPTSIPDLFEGHSTHAYVVDDDQSFRTSLVQLLMLKGWRVQSFGSGNEYLGELERLNPGVVLLDLRMPGLSGIETLRSTPEIISRHAVIMLTGHGDVRAAVEALHLGVSDFLEKPFAAPALHAAMAKASLTIEAKTERSAAQSLLEALSPREREVLTHLMLGRSNKVIAAHLCISPRTVEMHRDGLKQKLKVRTTSQAIHLAAALGAKLPSHLTAL